MFSRTKENLPWSIAVASQPYCPQQSTNGVDQRSGIQETGTPAVRTRAKYINSSSRCTQCTGTYSSTINTIHTSTRVHVYCTYMCTCIAWIVWIAEYTCTVHVYLFNTRVLLWPIVGTYPVLNRYQVLQIHHMAIPVQYIWPYCDSYIAI